MQIELTHAEHTALTITMAKGLTALYRESGGVNDPMNRTGLNNEISVLESGLTKFIQAAGVLASA